MFFSKKKNLLYLLLSHNFTKRIGTVMLIGGLTAGLIKIVSNLKTKKKIVPTGVYGAVAIAKVFKGADFPMSKENIIQKYGDKKIEYHIGKREKLRDILQNIPEQIYNRTADLEHALHETLEKHSK